MTNRLAFRKFLGILVLVTVLYICAVIFGLFYTFNWYDSMMHLIGGMAIGYFVISVIPHTLSRGQKVARAVGTAAAIGVAWEIFERVGNHYLPRLLAYGGTRDTMMDIAYAIIGAVIIVIVHRNNQPT